MAKQISMVISALSLILISGFASASRPFRAEAENNTQALGQKVGLGFNIGWGDGEPYQGTVGIGVGTEPWDDHLNMGWGDGQPWQGHIGIGFQASPGEGEYGACYRRPISDPYYAGSGCVDDPGYCGYDPLPNPGLPNEGDFPFPGVSWSQPWRQEASNLKKSSKTVEN